MLCEIHINARSPRYQDTESCKLRREGLETAGHLRSHIASCSPSQRTLTWAMGMPFSPRNCAGSLLGQLDDVDGEWGTNLKDGNPAMHWLTVGCAQEGIRTAVGEQKPRCVTNINNRRPCPESCLFFFLLSPPRSIHFYTA